MVIYEYIAFNRRPERLFFLPGYKKEKEEDNDDENNKPITYNCPAFYKQKKKNDFLHSKQNCSR